MSLVWERNLTQNGENIRSPNRQAQSIVAVPLMGHMGPKRSKQDDTKFDYREFVLFETIFNHWKYFFFHYCGVFFPFINFLKLPISELDWCEGPWGNLCVCVCACVCGEVKMVVVTVVSQRAPKSGWLQLLTTPRSLHANTLSSAA